MLPSLASLNVLDVIGCIYTVIAVVISSALFCKTVSACTTSPHAIPTYYFA